MMDVMSSPGVAASHRLSPSKRRRSSSQATNSTQQHATTGQFRLRRSGRISGTSGPRLAADKENWDHSNSPSTSAKMLETRDMELLSSDPIATLSLKTTPSRRASPLSRSPQRRALQTLGTPISSYNQAHDDASSGEDSDDSVAVFFGQPSSAEKKKRVRYEQKVIEKRLKHKDSLDLARQRPISFNPDDTMLVEDQTAYAWSWNRPTPTPSRSRIFEAHTPQMSVSPTKVSNFHSSPLKPALEDPFYIRSPEASQSDTITPLEAQALALEEEQQSPASSWPAQPGSDSPAKSVGFEGAQMQQDVSLVLDDPRNPSEAEGEAKTTPDQGLLDEEQEEKENTNIVTGESSELREEHVAEPETEAQDEESAPGEVIVEEKEQMEPVDKMRPEVVTSSNASDLEAPETANRIEEPIHEAPSPRKSPRKAVHTNTMDVDSSVRTVETLINATLVHYQQLRSPSKSPRRSPRLSLRQQQRQQSLSPSKTQGVTFSQAVSTPFRALPAASQPPPSTGLSSFACLQKRSEHPQEPPTPLPTTIHTFVSPQRAAAAVPPSPFIVNSLNFSYSPVRRSGLSCMGRNVPSRQAQQIDDGPSPFLSSPAKQFRAISQLVAQAEASSPASKVNNVLDRRAGPATADPQGRADLEAAQPESLRSPAKAMNDSPTPTREKESAATTVQELNKLDTTPGPVFRQTARRVPVQQHEADFGVKLSPDRRASPHKASYARSSALRSQEPTLKTDRIRARRVQVQVLATSSKKVESTAPQRVPSVATKPSRPIAGSTPRLGFRGASGSVLPQTALARPAAPVVSGPTVTARTTSSEGQSVAPKPSFVDKRNANAITPSQNSPKKAARPISGLPRPASATAGPGSRLPRPASAISGAPNPNRLGARPIPMALARLPPSQQPTANGRSSSSVVGSMADAVTSNHVAAQKSAVTGINATSAAPDASGSSSTQVVAARAPSPALVVVERPPSSARVAPAVVLDPEQQRLRCLAMQERARNRLQKGAAASAANASSSQPPSSDVEEPPGEAGSSPVEGLTAVSDDASSPAEPASDPSHPAAAERVKASSTVNATVETTTPVASMPSTSGRPLRSTRSVGRTLTPSTQRVPPARGRVLSLNDIIAARKVDVPLSLADQLRLADTVHKKQNEKILARYKISKIQRPYERPPSPDRHDHEPEACTIIDDSGSHRQGKGDLVPYSTPPPRKLEAGKTTTTTAAAAEEDKRVRWYRPLFVDKGSHYGNGNANNSNPGGYPTKKPALKPIDYQLDRMGNKLSSGNSPKLVVGHPITIYRNYFMGEPEPADD